MGALGTTAIALAQQGPGLVWGWRCPQPRARKDSQRAIEVLPSPTQSAFLTPAALRPQLWPEGTSEAPTSGHVLDAALHRLAWLPCHLPSPQAVPSAGPGFAQEGAFAPGHSPLLPSAACTHLTAWNGLNPILTEALTAQYKETATAQ